MLNLNPYPTLILTISRHRFPTRTRALRLMLKPDPLMLNLNPYPLTRLMLKPDPLMLNLNPYPLTRVMLKPDPLHYGRLLQGRHHCHGRVTPRDL